MQSELTVSTRIAFAKAWCDEVAANYDRVARKEAKLAELQSLQDGIKGVRYDRIGGGSGMEHGDDAIASRQQMIDDEMRNVEDAKFYAAENAREFDHALDAINQTYARLLAMRYEERRTWKHIADELDYSASHARYYIRNAALLDLYDVMPASRQMPAAI